MSIIERAIDRLTEDDAELAKKLIIKNDEALLAEVEPLSDEQQSLSPVNRSSSQKRVEILDKLNESGMITMDSGRSLVTEEYRRIKRHLLMNVSGRGAKEVTHANIIMVTSSLPDEGKTFSAINLAMSLAMEQDKTVLLVDADIAKPSVAVDLGIENIDKGLVDFLAGEISVLSDLILNTDVPKLKILPAGHTHQHATELLSSSRMNDLIFDLAERFSDRIIIFDSPPLLVTTEAAVLAEKMGQILMVVEAEKSQQKVVKDALALLDHSKIIGLILNKARIKSRGSSYGNYGYGYAKES